MIEAKRQPGWRVRLAAAMALNEAKPFAWGSNDCFLGVIAPAVEAMLGLDVFAEYRDSYDSEETGLQALSMFGFGSMADLVGKYFHEIYPARASVGDIALIQNGIHDPFGGVLGIVIGERIVTIVPEGRATVRLLNAHRAFRVG
jgi:hypothetical protein